MKKITFLSLIAATVLFTACGEETQKAAEEATVPTTETVEKDTVSAVDTAKIKAAEAAEAAKVAAAEMAKEAKVEAEKMASEASDKAGALKAAAKAKVSEAMETLTAAVTPASPPAAYGKCKGCHGADGKTAALGKSAVLAGQDKAALITSINEYKAGTRNVAGMGALMKGQVASLSDADIEAVAEYLSSLK